jgi:hypothetical protein
LGHFIDHKWKWKKKNKKKTFRKINSHKFYVRHIYVYTYIFCVSFHFIHWLCYFILFLFLFNLIYIFFWVMKKTFYHKIFHILEYHNWSVELQALNFFSFLFKCSSKLCLLYVAIKKRNIKFMLRLKICCFQKFSRKRNRNSN